MYGWHTYYSPRAIVLHAIGASSSKVSGMAFRMSLKNQPLLIVKNVPLKYYPSIAFKSKILWLGNLLSGIRNGHFKEALLSTLSLIVLLPKKMIQRVRIQKMRRRKGVKAKDIYELIQPGLPDLVKNNSTVKLAKKVFFWEKDI